MFSQTKIESKINVMTIFKNERKNENLNGR